MNFDALQYPYPSRRSVVYAGNGMVATSQSLAAEAGLAVLRQGGNAVDAAVAAAACLTVVEPTSCGIGGDAFALVWTQGKLYGLNASGPAPIGLSREAVLRAGHTKMPPNGLTAVTVPGVPAAWAALAERFGRFDLSRLLEPAAAYAADGFPVSPVVSRLWQLGVERYKTAKGLEFRPWFDIFAPGGQAPRAGQMWRSLDHAASLRRIGESGAKDFYEGDLAARIAAFSRQHDGYLAEKDLAAYRPEWVEPIGVNYRGYDVWEIPPNGHGLVTLLALNILQGFTFTEKECADTYHKQFEAMKLAFADGLQYIADPRSMQVSVTDLLSEGYAAERRKLIGREAGLPAPGSPPRSGTVYLATADKEGNMVSYIQSNYQGFGSGIVIPGTGIALHNRGCNFSLDANHPNCLEPGKKPYHTIIPGFLSRNGQAVGPFGVMGAFVQPQGHLQMVMNTVDFNLNPQAALDAPRWQWTQGKTIEVEPQFPQDMVQALRERGHDIKVAGDNLSMGRGQIIWRDQDGVLVGGTESRADGAVAAW